MARKILNRSPGSTDMLSARGTEPRLRIVRLLLSTHPEGLVAGEIAGASRLEGNPDQRLQRGDGESHRQPAANMRVPSPAVSAGGTR